MTKIEQLFPDARLISPTEVFAGDTIALKTSLGVTIIEVEKYTGDFMVPVSGVRIPNYHLEPLYLIHREIVLPKSGSLNRVLSGGPTISVSGINFELENGQLIYRVDSETFAVADNIMNLLQDVDVLYVDEEDLRLVEDFRCEEIDL